VLTGSVLRLRLPCHGGHWPEVDVAVATAIGAAAIVVPPTFVRP
jgi:hypothetical protein